MAPTNYGKPTKVNFPKWLQEHKKQLNYLDAIKLKLRHFFYNYNSKDIIPLMNEKNYKKYRLLLLDMLLHIKTMSDLDYIDEVLTKLDEFYYKNKKENNDTNY